MSIPRAKTAAMRHSETNIKILSFHKKAEFWRLLAAFADGLPGEAGQPASTFKSAVERVIEEAVREAEELGRHWRDRDWNRLNKN